MRTVVPSFNISIQPISDAATIVRPASLRNLAPDHTLILVNGKRRHRAAVITWLGNGIADGSQGPDLSVIPSIAIRQAEVLRDGAAAQYGSDAIAGVMNFQLKDARSGGSLEFRTGAYLDANPGSLSTCGEGIIERLKHSCNGIGGRGQAFTVAANAGLPLGRTGFVNLSRVRLLRRTDQPQHSAHGCAEHHRGRQYEPAQPGPGLGITETRGRPEAGQLRSSVREPIAILRPHQLREPHGDWRLLLRNPHTRGGVFRGPVRSTASRPCSSATGSERRDRRQGRRSAAPRSHHRHLERSPMRPPSSRSSSTRTAVTLHSRFPGGITPQFGERPHRPFGSRRRLRRLSSR